MNLIVDINPYLIKNYEISKFAADETLVANSYFYDTNKGAVEAIRILNMFDVDNKLFTFLGGYTGEEYLNILKGETSEYRIFKIRDKTVEKLEIYDKMRKLKVFTSPPRITNEEFSEIYSIFSEEMEGQKFIILTAAEGVSYEDEVYGNFINMAYKAGLQIGVSVNRGNIQILTKRRPYLLVLSQNTLEEYADTKLNFNWEVKKTCKGLLDLGVGKIILYNRKGNLQLFTKEHIYSTSGEDYVYKPKNLDRILAAYVAAMNRNYEEEMRLSIALAITAVDLKKKTFNRDAGQVKNLIQGIKVEKSNA